MSKRIYKGFNNKCWDASDIFLIKNTKIFIRFWYMRTCIWLDRFREEPYNYWWLHSIKAKYEWRISLRLWSLLYDRNANFRSCWGQLDYWANSWWQGLINPYSKLQWAKSQGSERLFYERRIVCRSIVWISFPRSEWKNN